MASKDTLWEKLLRCVRENPGISGAHIQALFIHDHTNNSISSSLTRLQTMGLIKNHKPGNPHSEWHPVERGSANAENLLMAGWLIEEMKKLPRTERVRFLAVHLANLTGGK